MYIDDVDETISPDVIVNTVANVMFGTVLASFQNDPSTLQSILKALVLLSANVGTGHFQSFLMPTTAFTTYATFGMTLVTVWM